MKRLAGIKALRWTALGLFCLSLSVTVASSAGFMYAINHNLFDESIVPAGGFDTFAYNMRYAFGIITVSCLVVSVLLLIFIMLGSGHKKGNPNVVLRTVDKLPVEVNALIISLIILGGVKLCLSVLDSFAYWNLFIVCPALLLMSLFFAEFFITLAIRYKANTLFKNSVTGFVCRLFYDAYTHFTLIWKVLFILFLYFTLTFLTFHYDSDFLVAIWIIATFILLAVAGSCVIFADTLKNGARRIAEGDLNFKINTTGMYSEFKKLGNSLNRISDGISKAVEEKTKSERLRTELITNVSHDIKTPLTSIINYIDLLKREDITPAEQKEYILVLERQAAKLKKLITDLVEASKALTGNITVNLAPTNLCELLNQAAAEYSERLCQNHLDLYTTLPETDVTVYADGRLVWRIFDNLLENICKYSLTGTRVYIDVVQKDDKVKVVFKNISRSVLNISPDELTERFVRGDSSRSTEGSGLGLSIALSLAEIQNASLDIDIDGDLFKVTVVFEVYKGENSNG